MKASLIWDHTREKPSVGLILRNRVSYIQYLDETSCLNEGLYQAYLEQPNLIVLAADDTRPGYLALVRTVRQRVPAAFLIVLEYRRSRPSPARQVGANLSLPASFTESQLLDAVLQAELTQSGPSIRFHPDQGTAHQLPDVDVFLSELQQNACKFPKQIIENHWVILEQRMESDANEVGWHLVSLSTKMVEHMRKESHTSEGLEQARTECLTILTGGPSVSLWKGAFEKMCTLFVEELISDGDAMGRQIVRLKQYVDEHIEEDVSLKHVAQKFFLSTSYLSRLFKNKAGINFSDYISMRKIERAKTLLIETDLTVAEISRRLNYPEQNSFSRFFKGKLGMSPQKFRSLNASLVKECIRAPEPILEDFEITDFGPCASTSGDYSFADSFHKRR
mgnify:CR=1 FL=1